MRRVIAAAVALAACAVLSVGSPAAASDMLQIQVSLDGRNIDGNTVTIDPGKPSELTLVATNDTSGVVRVRSVRVTGVALALTFFSYDTTMPFDVAPHSKVTRTLVLDFGDLGGQAIGLLPTTVEVVGGQRDVLASADTVGDVRGSLWSVYGVFGLALLILTALAWLTAFVAMARHRLSPNRWRRALRFLPAGVGTGLVAVVTLSVLRVIPPAPAIEIPVVLGAAAIALLLGYLTPHPLPPPPSSRDDDPTIAMSSQRFDQTTQEYA
jgi:hypothetical protein